MKAFKKLILYTFAGLGAVLVLVVAVVTAANLGDEPVRSEVQQILDHKPQVTDVERKAFYYFMGLYSGKSMAEAEAEGEKIWQSHGRIPARKIQKGNTFANDVPELKECDRKGFCSVADIEANPKLGELLIRYREPLESGRKLIGYGSCKNLFMAEGRAWDFFISPGAQLFSSHILKIQTIQWAIDLKNGHAANVLKEIENVNRFYRSVGSNGSYLDGMLAIVVLSRNMELLNTELLRRPGTKVPDSLIESFHMPDVNTLSAQLLNYEVRFFSGAVDIMRQRPGLGIEELGLGTHENWHDWLPARWLLKRGETLNQFYKMTVDSSTVDNAQPKYTLRNPIGTGLIGIFSAAQGGRNKKLSSKLDELNAKIHQLESRKS